MAKYTFEFKLQVVTDYLSGLGGCRTLSKKYHVNKSDVQKWVAVFKTHGEKGLQVKKSKRQYSIEFKLNAVHLVIVDGMSYRQAASALCIQEPSLIGAWLKIFREQGAAGFRPKRKGRPAMNKDKSDQPSQKPTYQELEQEIEYLKAEVAVLKKLKALREEKARTIKKNTKS